MKSKLEEFRDWIESARIGQVNKYHTGFLAVDRGIIIDLGNGLSTYLPSDVNTIALLALDAFVAGKLHLFQRKIHDGVYEYIAMKKSRYGRNW